MTPPALNGLTVTVDLFSALLDSRRGGRDALAGEAVAHGWDSLDPQLVFDCWDRENKRLHEEQIARSSWATFRQLAEEAMRRACRYLEVPARPEDLTKALLTSIPQWPPWSDSVQGLLMLSEFCEVGVLSNVDAEILATHPIAAHLHPDHLYTSERWHAYKPAPGIYLRTQRAIHDGGRAHVHIASSARDVRGAAAAGIALLHLRREGIPQPEESQPDATVMSSLTASANYLRARRGQYQHNEREET